MDKMIYFEEDPLKVGILQFVSKYVPRRLFRKERLETSLSPCFLDGVTAEKAYDRITWLYPDAIVYMCEDPDNVMLTHKHWLIAKVDGGKTSYYSHTMRGEAVWTEDINDAEIQLEEQGATTFADGLRRRESAPIAVCAVYLNRVNKLLTPSFIISCTSRKGGYTKFFARHEEGNRLRLVKTSGAAKRMTSAEAQAMFEELRCSNKAFSYSVMPAFKENVNCTELERLTKEGKVPLAVEVTTKLKWLNR